MKSLQNLSYKTLFTILFFSVAGIIFFLKIGGKTQKVSAAWWDEMWHYRKAISISNTLGSTLTNQRVKIIIDTSSLITAGKLQSDCDDIRITDINGNLLDHWDTECNTVSSSIYFKMASIPTTENTIYFYYGNPAANSSEKTLGSFENPGTSCQMMKNQGSTTTNGVYYITPGGNDIDKIQVYCNTDIIGYSWNLVINNGAYTIPPKPTWVNAVNENNITGTLNNNLDNFDLLLGLKHWNYLGNTALIQMGSSPDNITKRAHYSSFSLNTSNNYALTLSGQTIDLGGTAPGFYSGHNGAQFTTYDTDHDSNSGNCATYYSNTAWWYTSCWSGNIWGGGDVDSYQNKPYWYSSTTDYHNYGGIYIGGIDSMKNTNVGSIYSEELSPAPIAYWKFDEGVGTTAYDSIGNNNGSLSGTNLPEWQNENQCISGKCLYFNGVDNKVEISNFNYPSTWNDPFSISTWIYVPSSATWSNGYFGNIITRGNYTGSHGLGRNNTNNQVFMWVRGDNGSISVSGTITRDKWNHITGTWNGTEIQLFINGQLIGKSGSARTGVPGITTWRISQATAFSGGTGNWFNGYIDEPKIYPYARTADQIKQDYNARGSGSSQGSSVNLGSNKTNNSLSDGLVGYWKMDEGVGTSITDSSGNNNVGTLINVGWISGKFGIGTSFNGSNTYTTLPTIIGSSTSFSVTGWIKLNADQTSRTIFSNQTTNNNSWVIGISDSTTNILKFYLGNTHLYATTPLISNTWNHFSVTYNNGSPKIYINGRLDNSSTDLIVASGTYLNNAIGCLYRSGGCVGQYFNGSIDELKLYNRTLSPTEVSTLYNSAPGPIGYWNFNDGSGATIKDISGYGNNGTLGTGNSAPSWTQGENGSALYWDGSSNKYISLPNTSDIGNKSFTVLGWVNIPPAPARTGIFLGNFNDTPHMNLEVDSTLRFYWNGLDIHGTTNIKDNNWHYVTWVRDKDLFQFRMYIDGKLEIGYTGGSGSDLSFTTPFLIGSDKRAGGMTWHGKIDDIKIYNYARTQKQIIEDMNAGSPATSAKSMVAYYKFDEGNGNTNYDSSINKNNGIMGTGDSTPTWQSESNCVFGKCLYFKGGTYMSSRSQINNSIPLGNIFTISHWVKSNGGGGYTVSNAGGGNGYRFGINSNKIGFLIGNSSGYTETLCGTKTINDNKWHQITGIYDNPSKKFSCYVDGVYGGTVTTVDFTGFSTSAPAIGGYSFAGYIDEVKIYNYALTEEEIKQDYNRGSVVQFGTTNQTIGGTTTSLEYCIPGDTSYCASPITEWKMDEGVGTSTVDTSGHNNNSTFVNNNTWTQGKIGKAISLGSTISYLNTPTLSPTINTQKLTISGWFNFNSFSGVQRLISISNSYPMFGFTDTTFFVHTTTSNGTDNNKPYFTLPINCRNGWHYFTATWDTSLASNNINVFCDSVKIGSDTLINSINGTFNISSFWIGHNSQSFIGKVDHIKIYNYARTPAQIAYDYNKGSPVGWWKFDECQGNIAYDWSGIGNTGVINIGSSGTQNSLGTCVVGTSAAWTNGSTGKMNSSLNFDGVDDYVSITDTTNSPLDVGQPEITISVWIKPNTLSSGSHTAVGKNLPYILWINNTSNNYRVYSYLYKGGSWYGAFSANNSITLGTWQHVVITYDGISRKTYINGIQSGTTDTQISGNIDMSNSNITIGQDFNTRYFDGQIDDVRIYNYALTSEQIKQVYNGGAVNFQ